MEFKGNHLIGALLFNEEDSTNISENASHVEEDSTNCEEYEPICSPVNVIDDYLYMHILFLNAKSSR